MTTAPITPVAIAIPTCQEDRAQDWLERVRARLLPCDHYLVTFTLPQLLRAVARAHQTLVYAALLREAAAAAQMLADERTWVWRHARYPRGAPHVVPHNGVPSTRASPRHRGGLSPDGAAWVRPAHPRFLMPGYRLSAIFRAKMRAAFERAKLTGAIDPAVWTRPWTVHVQPIGSGEHATRYLAPYVNHVALTDHRLESFAHGRVTFAIRTRARMRPDG